MQGGVRARTASHKGVFEHVLSVPVQGLIAGAQTPVCAVELVGVLDHTRSQV